MEGILCEGCGVVFDDVERAGGGPGHPRTCHDCSRRPRKTQAPEPAYLAHLKHLNAAERGVAQRMMLSSAPFRRQVESLLATIDKLRGQLESARGADSKESE